MSLKSTPQTIRIVASAIIFGLFWICCFSSYSYGQVKRGTKVRKTSATAFHTLSDTSTGIGSGLIREKKWLVFSDREKNQAYTAPGSDIRLKTHGLLDVFYVAKEKGDYVHLVKYNPKLVQRKWRRRIANWKEMEDGGWVHRSQLLLSRNAFGNQDSKQYVKFITAINGNYEEVFQNPKRYFEGSLLKVYGAPDFTSTVTGKLPVASIVYAYKTSADRKFMLIAKSSQLSADSGKAELIGWLPSCMVSQWGERAFWQPLAKNAFIHNKGGAVKSEVSEKVSVLASPSNAAATVANIGLEDNLLNISPLFLQTIFPNYSVIKDTLANSSTIRTSLLTNAFDRNKNGIYTVAGSTFPYTRYLQIKKNAKNLNIVFLVDATIGGRSASMLQPLLSVLQNIHIRLDSLPHFNRVRYGAFFMKGRGNSCIGENKLPLTHNYVSLVNFFQDKLNKSLRCPAGSEHSVFNELADAADLLRNTEYETNIVVVVGATSSNASDYANWRYVVNKLTAARARLVVLQTHSGSSEDYNSFVIDAKNVVHQLANTISDWKKSLLTNPQDVKSDNLFRIEDGDFQSFYLDYPKHSMWQSMVLFPNKLQSLSPIWANQYLDTLLSQVHKDNERITSALQTIFNSYIGNIHTHIDKRFQHHFGSYTDALPEVFIRNMQADIDLFALPATLPYSLNDSIALGQQGVFVSTDELESLRFYFGRLSIPASNKASVSRKQAYRQIRKEIVRYKKQKKRRLGKRVKHLTLAEVTRLFTDYDTHTPDLDKYQLRDLKRKRKMSEEDYYAAIEIWAAYHHTLKSYYNHPDIVKQQSLGKDYYWIPFRF